VSELVRPLRVLGRYALYPPIASGGMATVHLGRLLGAVGFSRTVAIKRLHENFARDPQFVAMFVDEARLAARIQHPNVVDMLDVITTEGELFLVLGYVHGESLAWLFRAASARGERIPLDVLAGIIVGVLHGLHAAHEARSERGEPLDIVHRDVSPHNVLVGVDGIPRLLDFGVAKAAGRMQESRSGEIKGKLAYMAPEQVTGEADRRTDIYSTSVMLWEGLTGKRLLTGGNDAMLLRKLLEENVDAPSLHAPGVPAEVDELVLRGLAARPAARFATARDMARALEAMVAVASASAIGEWADGLAHDSLTVRARQVRIIEESSAILGTTRASDRPQPPTGDHAARVPGSEEATQSLSGKESDIATPPEGATLIASAHAVEPRRPRLRRAGPLALYGAIVLAGLALLTLQRRNRPATVSAEVSPTPNELPEAGAVTPASPLATATHVAAALSTTTAATATKLTGAGATSPRPASRPPQAATKAGTVRDLERAFESRK
jgi:serine/threonine-protein kinase